MSYDILDVPLHWLPFKWPGLAQGESPDSLSVPVEHEIELRVELVDREEAQRLFPRAFGDQDSEVLPDVDIFKRVVKDWRKIKMAGRHPDMNDENISRLMSVPMFAASFAATYIAALGGRTAIREGNSSGLPSGGQAGAPQTATMTSSSAIAAASESTRTHSAKAQGSKT